MLREQTVETSALEANSKRTTAPWVRKAMREIEALAFVIPYLVAFVLFLGIPIVFGIYISLNHWNPIVGGTGFVGIQQYINLFDFSTLNAQQFWQSMVNTIIFVLISVPFLVGIPLILAYAIYRAPFKNVFRAFYFFPAVLSATAVSAIWVFLLATQGGAINDTFAIHVPWLVDQPYAWISIDLTTIWWSLGFNLIVIYAGITQLPQATLEAAAIDGAGPFRTFFFVVIPQLRNVLAFVFVIATIASFNLFAQSFLMTGGGPGFSTQSVSQYIYNQGFNELHMGSASAMAFIMGIILAIIAFFQYRFAQEKVS
jgi:multiple sugar transport system permease protein